MDAILPLFAQFVCQRPYNHNQSLWRSSKLAKGPYGQRTIRFPSSQFILPLWPHYPFPPFSLLLASSFASMPLHYAHCASFPFCPIQLCCLSSIQISFSLAIPFFQFPHQKLNKIAKMVFRGKWQRPKKVTNHSAFNFLCQLVNGLF